MNWFDKDVGAAVKQCKQKNVTLMVYINGDDSMSEEMNKVMNATVAGSVINEAGCVALKLANNSVEGQQFSQIYPVISVPSVFFIGSNGVLREVISGSCTVEDFCTKARRTLQNGEPSNTQGSVETDAADSGEQEQNLTDRVNKAKEKIRLKQQQKMEEEKEKSRLQELERRKLGADVEKLKQFKAEREAKETREQLKREKEETRLAREKVREEIARDRAVRQAKYQKEKQDKEEALQKKKNEKLEREAEEKARIVAQNSNVARLQFRLPDGASVNNQFEADDTLSTARDFISLHSSNPLGQNFRLATIYPRRVFEPVDYTRTFRELDLVPSSALMVLPPARGGGSGIIQSSSVAIGWFDMLLAPLIMIRNYLYIVLFGRSQNQSERGNHTVTQTNSEATTTNQVVRPKTARGRREGRLSDLPKDDDMNTWNGNSTQQQ